MLSHTSRVALITGGIADIGRATADLLSAEGNGHLFTSNLQ